MNSFKCINCLSRFVHKSKNTFKDISIEDHGMATWDDNYWYGGSIGDLGLKTCPFNSKHKLKPSHYLKHVTKCEQQFPKKSLSRCSTINLNSNQFTSIDSCIDVQSVNNSDVQSVDNSDIQSVDNSDIQSVDNSEVDRMPTEDWTYAYEEVMSAEASTSALTRSLSPDSAIGLNNNSSNETEAEVHTNEDIEHRTDDSGHNEDIIPSDETPNTSAQMVPIVPQAIAIRESEPSNVGSGDPDDWTSGQPYSLYEGYENMDDLTEDQIMKMADSFIDTVVLAHMTKKQRKVLNEKIIKLKKAEKDRKIKAFNELVTFHDIWDPELKEIPQEIRKPRVDVRDLFKLNKKEDNPIEALKRNTPISPEPKQCPPNPWTPDILFSTEGQSSEKCSVEPSVDSSNSKSSQVSSELKLNTVCNSCWHSLDLNEENIKRMTVFCAKCSGIKFGGYFECQSCKLYGYFANSQISQHLTKHFPENK